MTMDGLILPALALGFLAFIVPRLFARVLPEGVAPLLLNGFVSTVTMSALSASLFFFLYVGQGADAGALAEQGLFANIWFFGRLGLSAALIWAPILIL